MSLQGRDNHKGNPKHTWRKQGSTLEQKFARPTLNQLGHPTIPNYTKHPLSRWLLGEILIKTTLEATLFIAEYD